MQRFQDTGIIQISSGTQQFTCPTSEFITYEPSYQPLQKGQVRRWEDAIQCLHEGGNQKADPFYTPERFAFYLSKIADYQAAYDTAHQPTQAELDAIAKQQALDVASLQAKTDFATIPAWMRTGTAEQGEAWIETNVTNLATAKVALKNLVRVIVLLRDFVKFSS